MRIMLSIFDRSTVMAQPWAEAGFLCYCVDRQHEAGESREGNIIRVGCDVLEWLPPRGDIAFVACFPPCTHVSVSGARWFRDKGLGGLIESLRLFDSAVKVSEWSGAPYLIENPVSTVSTYWRKPDHSFDPCDYGDGWTKKTCLWTGGGFVMPEKRRVAVTAPGRIHRMPPSDERANLRSETPPGFARAVFEANCGLNLAVCG